MGMPKPEMLKLIPRLPTLCEMMSERETIVLVIGDQRSNPDKSRYRQYRITGRLLIFIHGHLR